MKTIKEQADSYAEMFKPFVSGETGGRLESISATHCAIIHVEGILKAIPKEVHGWHEYVTNVIIVKNPDIEKYEQILMELKSRI